MKSRRYLLIVVLFVVLATGSPVNSIDYRLGTGMSIHGSNLAYDPGAGYNFLIEVGRQVKTGHFLGLHLGYSGFLYEDNKKVFHLGEIGFISVLNIAHYRPNPYAVLGIGYSLATEGSDNGAYLTLGLGWKHRLSESKQVFIQAAVDLGVNGQKQGLHNDPGYLYIPITIGLDFYTP